VHMNRLLAMTVCTAAAFCTVVSADDASEKGVPTTPLKIYSGGIGAGAMKSLNTELEDKAEQLLKVSFINSIHFREYVSLFMDANWLVAGKHFGGGADLGFDVLFASGDFRPFAGAGVGAHYIDKSDDFGDNFGPSGTVHVGFLVDITDAVQLRFRVPYHFIANEARDQMIGVDAGFLFSNRFRKVRKLNY
jgi:hypothetical protein